MLNLAQIERQIASDVSETIQDLMDEGFIRKRAPDGTQWELDQDGNPFDPHDSIRSSIRIKPSGNEIRISSDLPFVGYHQSGTKHLPKREMYPDTVLPRKWQRAIQENINTVMEEGLMREAS